MKLAIKEPCHEDWNKMKIGMHSRHCAVCVKNVFDFTTMNRAEIITHLLSNPNESVCGRMRPDQFDFRHEDIPVLVEVLKSKPRNHAFLILALVCLSLSAQAQENTINIPRTEQHVLGKMAVQPTDTVKQTNCTPVEDLRPFKGEVVIQGNIAPFPDPEPPATERVLAFAQTMPEYPGGMDNLFNYIQSYFAAKAPEQKGTIYVRFVVRRNGYLTDVEILRIPDNLSYLGRDVIEMVRLMPAWIPGEQDGKKVDVYYTIPVRFQ